MNTRQTTTSTAVIQGLDDAGLISALEANTYEAYADMARNPQGMVNSAPDRMWFISGAMVPLLNGVAGARFSDGDPGAQIEAALQPFVERGTPMYWWVGPSTEPANLGSALETRGLERAGGMPGMVVEIERLAPPTSVPSGFTIAHVSTPSQAEAWARAFMTGFNLPPHMGPVAVEMSARQSLRPASEWTYFLGLLDGAPVATSALFCHAGVAGVYCVATVPAARRQGIGAAMTDAALLYGQRLGYRVGVLQASQMGQPIYEAMGFETPITFHLYEWSGA